MTIPNELPARLIMARSIAADFTGNASISIWHLANWREWCWRLHTALTGLIAALDNEPRPVTFAVPDGTVTICATDMATVLGALSDAAVYNPACAVRYRALSRALGDDR